MCGIDLAEFQMWFRRESSNIAIAQAQLASLRVVPQMGVDAESSEEFCERCDGLGWIKADEDLPVDTPGKDPVQADRRRSVEVYRGAGPGLGPNLSEV
jgi:hypothetical protein